MQFKLGHNIAKVDCFVIIIDDKKNPVNNLSILPAPVRQIIKEVISQKQLPAIGKSLFIPIQLKANCPALIIGHAEKTNTEKTMRSLFNSILTHLNQSQLKSVQCFFNHLTVTQRDNFWIYQHFILHVGNFAYHYCQNPFPVVFPIKKFEFFSTEKSMKLKQTIFQAKAMIEGINLTKDLGNLPPNICTPQYLAQTAKDLATEFDAIKTSVLDTKALAKLNMNALLAVGQGSLHPPHLILMEYKGNNDAPICLVGKGITFDTGGLQVKAKHAQLGMKFDMCGAAAVFGVMKAIASMQLPIHVIGVVSTAENMVDKEAFVPESVITTMKGIKVEITNTDAEGRLVLCDALTYCERFEPRIVIDVATLTGAVVSALGEKMAGLFSDDDALLKALIDSGEYTHDRCWRLPMNEEYAEELASTVADCVNSNIPKTYAGASVAACFLAQFTEKFRWAHLDVAGTASTYGGSKQLASGKPVAQLTHFLIQQVEK